jgi:hypothetical protein
MEKLKDICGCKSRARKDWMAVVMRELIQLPDLDQVIDDLIQEIETHAGSALEISWELYLRSVAVYNLDKSLLPYAMVS